MLSVVAVDYVVHNKTRFIRAQPMEAGLHRGLGLGWLALEA